MILVCLAPDHLFQNGRIEVLGAIRDVPTQVRQRRPLSLRDRMRVLVYRRVVTRIIQSFEPDQDPFGPGDRRAILLECLSGITAIRLGLLFTEICDLAAKSGNLLTDRTRGRTDGG